MGLSKVFLIVLFSATTWATECRQPSANDGSGRRRPQRRGHIDTSGALFLTPLIRRGKVKEAKERSQVGELGAERELPGHSGFITVNEKYTSNIFFWFVPSEHETETAPVVLWMTGGPGTSSLMAFFGENGPYRMNEDGKLVRRPFAWTNRFSVIYVDQPVGTGFSFTKSARGYARSMKDVARDMLEFLEQFFTLFEEFSHNDFYVTGESYAGKYVPALAAAIHQHKHLRVKINLVGVAMGNGFTDPAIMTDFGSQLWQLGLVQKKDAAHMMKAQKNAIRLLKKGRTAESFHIMDSLFFGVLAETTYFRNVTGFHYYYNFLQTSTPAGQTAYKRIVQIPRVRRAIHVGDRPFNKDRAIVMTNFIDTFMTSETRPFKVALENYRVLVYSGLLDLCVPTVATEKFLEKLQWSGRRQWERAERKLWLGSDGDVLAYVKQARNLSFVVVRGAGHVVPYDQPAFAFDMISRFFYRLPFVAH